MSNPSMKHNFRSTGKQKVRSTGKSRVITMLVIVATVVLGLASAAMAVAPTNDDRSTPTLVGEIGFTDSIDTTDATTAPDDPECFGQGPTVWYSFTPTETTFIGANTFGSEYDTTLSAYVEEAGSLLQIACNDDSLGVQSRVRFEAQAGVTYLFMVGSFFSSAGGPMMFNLIQAPPPVQIDVSIDSRGAVSARTGLATLRGTVTCSGPTQVYIDGSLRQRAGRVFIEGGGSTVIDCDGTTPWSLEVQSFNGIFAGGRADANVFAASFEDDSFDFESATIRLTGSRR